MWCIIIAFTADVMLRYFGRWKHLSTCRAWNGCWHRCSYDIWHRRARWKVSDELIEFFTTKPFVLALHIEKRLTLKSTNDSVHQHGKIAVSNSITAWTIINGLRTHLATSMNTLNRGECKNFIFPENVPAFSMNRQLEEIVRSMGMQFVWSETNLPA